MTEQPIDILQLRQVQAIVDAAVNKALAKAGLITPYISLKEAEKMYGRGTVARWADERLITIIKDGTRTSKCRINRAEIELVASMSNRASWYEHHEDE